MANKYPYVASAGPLSKTVEQLRRSFPKEVKAETLRKLGLAPKNESYVINILRFLDVIDGEGKKIEAKTTAFMQHKDEAFASEFEKLVKGAYQDLFDLHGEGAWDLDRESLTQFFRTSDHSTEVVGKRQAGTFVYLAGLSGHSELPTKREGPIHRRAGPAKIHKLPKNEPRAAIVKEVNARSGNNNDNNPRFGLTVRVEVNLPAEGNQTTYDNIFQSIRRHLIDGD